MNVNLIIGGVCLLGALILLVGMIMHFIVWMFQLGYAKGRADAEHAWIIAGRAVDETRQAIWREEAS